MRNPLRSEAEAFRFLIVVVVGAAVIIGCAYANTWLGVAAAVLVVGGISWWLWRSPPGAAQVRSEPLEPPRPAGRYRILLVAPPDAAASLLGDGLARRVDSREAEVLVVVPALAPRLEALTGAVDDRREEAQQAADRLAAQLARAGVEARGTVGADEPVLAAEDALREFGADEVLVADADEELLARMRERIAVPVSRLS